MNILLVSQCEKRALSETRRILDQFAERRGERTWQTPITQAGLDTLRRLLKKSARRNTAVACHWIRGRDHSELLWIVGDASRFNAQGAVPTNRTRRDILRKEDENDWHSAEDIRLLTVMAALFHDIGKASQAFQAKLRNRGKPMADAYRHEWVSLRLFEAFVGPGSSDEDWLRRLADKRDGRCLAVATGQGRPATRATRPVPEKPATAARPGGRLVDRQPSSPAQRGPSRQRLAGTLAGPHPEPMVRRTRRRRKRKGRLLAVPPRPALRQRPLARQDSAMRAEHARASRPAGSGTGLVA
ncbi:HD domain-containing protein [Pseudomonas aeruginosa]|nr:HD domain-containing protein [Pseudomonas aeruginosa]